MPELDIPPNIPPKEQRSKGIAWERLGLERG